MNINSVLLMYLGGSILATGCGGAEPEKISTGTNPMAKGKYEAVAPPFPSPNLACNAQISASSAQAEHAEVHAVDGDLTTDWVSANDAHPWFKLQWNKPVTVDRLVACQRLDLKQQARIGKVLFSDGSTLDWDDIPSNGKPREVRFAPRTITWLRLDLFGQQNKEPGLAEIEVYSDGGQIPQDGGISCPKPGTLVLIDEKDPRIAAVDNIRGGQWSGAMWCPFAGTSVKLIATTGPKCGMADIYIDGVFQTTVDWYSPNDAHNVPVFAADKLADGKHLLGVLTREAKRPEAKGTAINWSRIEFIAGAQPERFVPVYRTQFDPNAPLWLDNRGEPIQCHMGGVMYHDGKYYLLGTDWRGKHLHGWPFNWAENRGFAVYSSTDLMNWTYHANYCGPSNEPNHPLYNFTHVVGRVRPIRANGTGKFIALFQVVDDTFKEINVIAAAMADKPEGPYRWHGILQCDGKPVQGADTAVFSDDDGTQYLLSGANIPDGWNVADCLYQLAPNCLSAVKCARLGTNGEAPSLFKHAGTYYLLHSQLTGLQPNENFYHTATNIWGPWQAMGKIAQGPHSDKTFQTQTMDVIPVAGKSGKFIWIGDSVRDNLSPYTRTVWLPLAIKAPGEIEINWRNSWQMNSF